MPPTQTKSACRKRFTDPAKACSVPMPEAMQAALIRRAKADDRSFSATVRRAIELYLAR